MKMKSTDSLAPLTVNFSDMPSNKRMEYIKCLADNKINFVQDEEGNYTAVIKIANNNSNRHKLNNNNNNNTHTNMNNYNNNNNIIITHQNNPDNHNIMLSGTFNKNFTFKKKRKLSTDFFDDTSDVHNNNNNKNNKEHKSASLNNKKKSTSSNTEKESQKENYKKIYKTLYSFIKPLKGIRAKKMNLYTLKFAIEEIYSFCFYEDANEIKSQLAKKTIYNDEVNRNGEVSISMPEKTFSSFVYHLFCTKYQKKMHIDQNLLNLLISLDYYKEENKDIQIFSKFLTEEYSREELLFFLFIRACLEKETGILFLERAQKELDIQFSEEREYIDLQIYLNEKICINLACALFGENEDELLEAYFKRIQLCYDTNKNGFKAIDILFLILEDYHNSNEIQKEQKKFYEEQEAAKEEQETGKAKEIEKNKNNNKNNEGDNDNDNVMFYQELTSSYNLKQQREGIQMNVILQDLLNTYLKERYIHIFISKYFEDYKVSPDKMEKVSQIETLILKNLYYLISVIFQDNFNIWIKSLNIMTNFSEESKQFRVLSSSVKDMFNFPNITFIKENKVIEFFEQLFNTKPILEHIFTIVNNNI